MNEYKTNEPDEELVLEVCCDVITDEYYEINTNIQYLVVSFVKKVCTAFATGIIVATPGLEDIHAE